MTKYTVKLTSKFRKDYKLAMKQKRNIELLDKVITALAKGEELDEKYKDHDLKGDWKGHRECHILPDWLLICRYDEDVLVLALARLGSHSELF